MVGERRKRKSTKESRCKNMITIRQILCAVANHPFPIETYVAKPINAALTPFTSMNEELCNLPGIITERVDVRPLAEEAYKIFTKEQHEQLEEYQKLQREFEKYKEQNAIFEKFRRFEREGRYT